MAFVQQFFSPTGILRHGVCKQEGEEAKIYDVPFSIIWLYFDAHFRGGITNVQLVLDRGMTDRALQHDSHLIENSRATFIYWFGKRSHVGDSPYSNIHHIVLTPPEQVIATGTLRARFDSQQKFEIFEFLTTGYEEFVSRNMVIQAAKPSHEWVKEWHRVNAQDSNQSPELNKKIKARPKKSPQSQPPDLDLPGSYVLKSGVPNAVMTRLEVRQPPIFPFEMNVHAELV
jgi:hypothetical protein